MMHQFNPLIFVLLLVIFPGRIYSNPSYKIDSFKVNSNDGSKNIVPVKQTLDFNDIDILHRRQFGGKFFEVGVGKLNCSTLGAKRVSSVSECKRAALALNFDFKNSEVDDNYPSGCYVYKGKEVFWNKHAIGAKDKESSPICKLGSSQLSTCFEHGRRCNRRKECCSRKCNHYTTRRCS